MKPLSFLCILSTLTLAACTQERISVPECDWANTTYLFSADDEAVTTTYYKPYAGYVGDPMPFYDPQSRTFLIGYLQDYIPILSAPTTLSGACVPRMPPNTSP